MKTIKLRNFRSLKDTGDVSVDPITILLGQNSSGKSTFLRSLALLKQSIGVRAREPFLWVGELVDFGGLSETLSSFADDDVISFSYAFEAALYDALSRPNWRLAQPGSELQKIKVSVAERGKKGGSGCECFEYVIEIDQDSIAFVLTAEGEFREFKVNGRDYLHYVTNRYTVKVWRGPIPAFTRYSPSDSFEETTEGQSFSSALSTFIDQRMHGRTGDERRRALAIRLSRAPFSRLLQTARTPSAADTKWNRAAERWTPETPDFKHLRDLVIGVRFIDIVNYVNEYTTAVLENVKYVTPLRANAERYYRKQGLAVHELDPKGTNFALFLDNMSATERRNFSDWSVNFFGVSIGVSEGGGHLSLYLRPSDLAAQDVNIADTGFGFSQMFPILAQLWTAQRNGRYRAGRQAIPVLFAIEQPELHLHPRLQAQLADVFASSVQAARSIGIDLRLIIETHSEYLVNRLGYLIAKDKFESSDASVLVFERDSFSQPTSIRRATYTEEGFLENWPYGFFEPSV
ncbi:AAA family ATPase [Cupriavidus gilardii]|nr:AAA family ATPase [Cupriavidus gilardii]